MKLSTPEWWYEREPRTARLRRTLLRPVAAAWAKVTADRIARATPFDPGVPVICVGNLTVGGTGKTPVVRELLRRLTEAGIAAHGLSRGYGGSLAGPIRVDPTIHTAAEVGDEPLMLAQDFPVWISRDRPAGARAAVAAGAEAIVMDDGHQNPSLEKALSIVVVDGETRNGEWPFGDGKVFPAGPMREPLAAGMARTDAVVVMLPADMPAIDPELAALFSEGPMLTARLAPEAAPPPGRLFAFAGVGKPWKVERSLKAAGADLADFAPFADHQAYDAATLRFLEERALALEARLVTTEKDWVRLPAAWRERVTPWPVRAVFDEDERLNLLLEQVMSPGAGQ